MIPTAVLLTEEFGSLAFLNSDSNNAGNGDRFKVERDAVKTNESLVSSNSVESFRRLVLLGR